ncbi:MAG: hypothetical protein B6D41_15425 [Chloroflexi bacterium UTCFX4]|jgi:hypothetical protein|nr:MAG: hypothetical protein B6D41_15425 [Chloroflexi bacterium UTCFX4]
MDELPAARRQELMERVCAQLRAWNLREPALVLLNMHLPLALVGSQFLLVAEPFLGIFTGERAARELVWLFQDPRNIEQLALQLEQPAES